MGNLSNFKAQMKYKNIETRLDFIETERGCQGSHELGKLEDIFSLYANTYFWLRDM